jgi:dihydroflavonol-4-reductase
MMETE